MADSVDKPGVFGVFQLELSTARSAYGFAHNPESNTLDLDVRNSFHASSVVVVLKVRLNTRTRRGSERSQRYVIVPA